MEALPAYLVFGMLIPAYFGWHAGARKGWKQRDAAMLCFALGWIGYIGLMLVQDSPAHVAHRQAAVGTTPASSLPDELAKLAALRDSGSLTPDEFEASKKRLIERG